MADTETKAEPMQEDYLATIQELKNTTVSKSEYDKMLEENRKLLNTIVNGEQINTNAPKETIDINNCRKAIFNEDSDNLTLIENALALREQLITRGGREADPFVPHGAQIVPTEEDFDASQRVAEGLQACVDYADGNSEVFTNELQRIMRDVKGYR